MVLHVDDFGCVPDGRFLEQVSIDPGSAVLNVPGGGLRSTDTGKNVAVPGAVDLVATIGLAKLREVKNASMTLDDPTRLTGTLIDPAKPAGKQEEDFVAAAHEGRRITVAGAGPGGQSLLTNVVDVVDATTVLLADAASTAVAAEDNAEVILNDPAVAVLSNYARRPVADLTVDLGDRSIDDGEMSLGGRGLGSETAKFSSLDVGKVVTIRAAGLLVTTIQSVGSAIQATLAAPAQHAVPEAAADVWQTDSRPGFESLLASLDGQDVESAEIRFGEGVYDFTRVPVGPGPQPAAIGLRGLSNLTLRGSGSGATVLRLMPAQELTTDTHVIETVDCTKLTFQDLSVHGAYLTLGNAVEQMHGININAGSAEIAVNRVRVFQSAGDGIRLLGRPDRKVSKVWVEECRLIQNKRTGVGFQRGVEFVWVRDCYIEMTAPSSDQCVDFEPSRFGDATVAPTDVIIESNVLVHEPRGVAVAISGVRDPDPARRVTFADNIVLGGEVFCTDVAELTIRDNVILVRESDRPARILLNVQRGGESLLITGNQLIGEHEETGGAISLSEVNQRQVSRALVAGNLCRLGGGQGIQITGSDDVSVEGNMVVATGRCLTGVRVHAETSSVDRISVRGNDITVEGPGVWQHGVLLVSRAQPIHRVSVVDNSIAFAAIGIGFQGTAFTETPLCALNRTEGAATPLAGLDRLPEDSIVGGGGASTGGPSARTGSGRFLVGVGDPNGRGDPPSGKVRGNVGDLYQRLDENPEAALYVKESGDNTTTGWTPK